MKPRAPTPSNNLTSALSRIALILVMVVLMSPLALAAGCSDNDSSRGSNGNASGPLYLVATQVPTLDDVGVTYLLLVDSLEATEAPDYDNSVALDGFASVFGVDGQRDFWVGQFETPVITRWRIEDDGTLTRGDQLSFAALGVASTAEDSGVVTFVSDTKAYFPAPGRLIVWNPQTMEITGEIDLGVEALSDDLLPQGVGSFALRSDGMLMIPVHWSSRDFVTLGDRVRVITVDTSTDTVVEVAEDDRCGYAFHASLASDDTAYIDGGPWTRVYTDVLGSEFGATPCHLRVVPPGQSFDAGYFVDLSTLTGGRPTGDFFLLDDETAALRVFHPEDAPNPFDGDALAYAFQPAYRWWIWRIGEPEATVAQTGEAVVVTGQRFNVDGTPYLVDATEDYSSSTLISFSDEGEIVEGLTVRGSPRGVLRIM